MKRLSVLALALVPLATAALFACEDDGSSGSSGGFTPDGGSFEASTPPLPDAAPPPADAAVPDAPAPVTSVTVRVMSVGQPVPGIEVVFHDATGAVLGSAKTAADGRATSTGATPAMASALLGRGNNFNVVTWTAVEAGDELVVEEAPTQIGSPSLSVAFPSVANAVNYTAMTGSCQSSGKDSPLSIFLAPSCMRASNPILVRAADGNGGNLGFASKKGTPSPVDGGALSVTTGAFAAADATTVDASNIPNEPGNVQVGVTDIADGVGFPAAEGFLYIDGPRSFKVPAAGFADARQTLATFTTQAQDARITMLQRAAPAPANVLDFAQALPRITAADVTPGADPRRFEITWTAKSALSAADGGIVRVMFSPNDGRDASFQWSFVVPPGAATSGSVKAPAMPSDASGYIPATPDAGGTFFMAPEVMFVDSSLVPSYAVFRRQAGTAFDAYEYGPRELNAVLPSNGTFRATSFSQPTL